ncbi:MAG TPA: Fe-S cluster assembly scaffold IscU [Bryobacterales bacterium]|nr:Fe-S cluster assembly scaffold IscU [Bryobacterales bacterium]
MPEPGDLIDHFNQPRNIGALDKDDPDVGTGTVGAAECGDVMRLQLKVNDRTGVIEDAKFKTFGCGSAIASSSLATEWIKGKTLDQALEIDKTEILNELSLPPAKIHCTMMAEDAIRAAIADYKAKRTVRERFGPGERSGVLAGDGSAEATRGEPAADTTPSGSAAGSALTPPGEARASEAKRRAARGEPTTGAGI